MRRHTPGTGSGRRLAAPDPPARSWMRQPRTGHGCHRSTAERGLPFWSTPWICSAPSTTRGPAARCTRCRRGSRSGTCAEERRASGSDPARRARPGRAPLPNPQSMTMHDGRAGAPAARSTPAGPSDFRRWAPTSTPPAAVHHLGHPVAGQVQRLEPLDTERLAAGRPRPRVEVSASRLCKPGDQLLGLSGQIERRADRGDIGARSPSRVRRCSSDSTAGAGSSAPASAVDLTIGHRADLAQAPE